MNSKTDRSGIGQRGIALRDAELIWHPFTQMKTAGPNLAIDRAGGALLIDVDGNQYIDAIGSWWVNLHGHAHPHIVNQIHEQAKKLPHVMFAGFTHEPAVTLCERLQRWLPKHLKRFFFSDNGSTATEIALKMAFQVCQRRNAASVQAEPKSTSRDAQPFKVVALEGSYHGDTFGAMAVGERDAFVKPFEPYLFDVIYIPAPIPGQEKASRKALQRVLDQEPVSAFIFEPLVQGAFGMQMHSPESLDDLLSICREHHVLTIADEVMTGFFKTGTCFAVHQLKQSVDFICLSKALSGGTLPLALTVTTEPVFEAFYDDQKGKAFFHGHTYTGNPLGCAAAIASLDLIESGGFKPGYARVCGYLESKASAYRDRLQQPSSPFVDVRNIGMILALELKVAQKIGYLSDLGPMICQLALKRGVLLRPLGEVIYVVPPVCISEAQLDQVFRVIDEIAANVATIAN